MEVTEFKKAVLPFSPKLLRFAIRILEDTESAKDVVQDVFLKLWLMRDKLSNYRNLEAYAMTMTRNLCIDLLRRTRPVPLNESFSAELDDPEAGIEARDTGSRVMQIVSKLPEQQRTVIHLKDIEGYSTGEVMDILGINANTLRVNLSRARKKVRDIMLNKNTTPWIAER